MFVDIEDFKNAIAVENILTPYKKGRLADDKKTRLPKEPITPEVCMEILKSTNYARNIKDMLECIAEIIDDVSAYEQISFKNIVLATFERREQPYEVVKIAENIAERLRFEWDLRHLVYVADEKKRGWYEKPQDGEYILSAPNVKRARIFVDDVMTSLDLQKFDKMVVYNYWAYKIEDCVLPEVLEFPYPSSMEFHDDDFEHVKQCRFNGMRKVKLFNCKNIQMDLDVAQCDVFEVHDCDLQGVNNIILKDGVEACFNKVQNLPAHLDIAKCQKVQFCLCDFAKFDNVQFRENADVTLSSCYNFPQDFSSCGKVKLENCSLNSKQPLRFRDNAEVVLNNMYHVSIKGDFSNCRSVTSSFCDLSSLDNLCFQDNAHVSFMHTALPEQVDVSRCSKVHVYECDFRKVKRWVFQNKKQMDDWRIKFPENWKGEIVFADEQLFTDGQLTKFNMMMAAKTKGGR